MEHGALLDLIEKKQRKKSELTDQEIGVLFNFKHCDRLKDGIECQGDVHRIANGYQEAEKCYKKDLERDEKDTKTRAKLSELCVKTGKNEEAGIHVKKCFEDLKEQSNDKNMIVFSSHVQQAKIDLENYDFVGAQ